MPADAFLAKDRDPEAQQFLSGDIEGELAKRGVSAKMHKSRMAGQG
jgi:hypothetical protein